MATPSRLRRIAVPLAIMLSIVGLLHYFIFAMATRSLEGAAVGLVALALIAGLLLVPLSLIIGMSGARKRLAWVSLLGYLWLGVFFIAFFFSIAEFILAIVLHHPYSYWTLVAAFVVSLYGHLQVRRGPRVIEHKLKGPAFLKGFRLAQVSDVHVGMPLIDRAWLETTVDRVRGAKPDALVITGDLADGEFADTAPMLEPLRRIEGPKYYVTGNHEYIRGGDWEQALHGLGFEVLHNTHDVLERGGGRLLIAGVPDRMVNRFLPGRESNPDKALKSVKGADYKILLAHEPSSVFDLKHEKADLLLAGHTHGGQIFPFALLVRLQQPVSAGFKRIRDTLVFAHMGTGYWGPPIRWFTRCEIVIFQFE